MMTVQSDRYTKLVFLGFLLTVFGFGFFQEPPQPNYNVNKIIALCMYVALLQFL